MKLGHEDEEQENVFPLVALVWLHIWRRKWGVTLVQENDHLFFKNFRAHTLNKQTKNEDQSMGLCLHFGGTFWRTHASLSGLSLVTVIPFACLSPLKRCPGTSSSTYLNETHPLLHPLLLLQSVFAGPISWVETFTLAHSPVLRGIL